MQTASYKTTLKLYFYIYIYIYIFRKDTKNAIL